jgi:hypothetical protein
MGQLNSRRSIPKDEPSEYLTSETGDSAQQWGQPPASHYTFGWQNNPSEVQFISLVCMPFKEEIEGWFETEDIPALQLSRLATESLSYAFLNNPEEDIYTPEDGQPI